MTAVASMGGVIASTEPGAVVLTTPFSDSFTRSDGPAGQPWYAPGCLPELGIVSDVLTVPGVILQQVGLLLPADDFSLTFDVTYAAADGNFNDVQVAFRADTCWGPNYYLWATDPDTGVGGTHGISLYSHDVSGYHIVNFQDDTILPGSTHTMGIAVTGTTCDLTVDGSAYFSSTIAPVAGQRAVWFLIDHPGSSFDNVSVA